MSLRKYYFNYWKEKERNSLDFISFIMMTCSSYWEILKSPKELTNMLKSALKVSKNLSFSKLRWWEGVEDRKIGRLQELFLLTEKVCPYFPRSCVSLAWRAGFITLRNPWKTHWKENLWEPAWELRKKTLKVWNGWTSGCKLGPAKCW